MQTLRKKTSPLKYKNETVRFVGDGVCFKAKLIGILEVSEARGDRMCQEALSDLKMAIRAAGEHKQRITINIAIDGLRLRDEKTGDSLYHHPVHKISFIAQDMSDSRAFGYIFGSPDTGHRFFGIKTDKAASQVVIAMRDLFQVVFAIKKKEIEMAKKFVSSPIYSDRSLSNSKSSSPEPNKNASSDSKGAGSLDSRPTPAVADLVDLELELNSLQQGLTQMERITPSDPFGPKDDPFGDSFTSYPQKPILPPPPSGRERANRVSESSSLFSPKTPHTAASHDSTNELFASRSLGTPKDFTFNDFNSSHDEPSSGDWFTPPAGNSLFEEAPPPKAAEAAKDQHEAVKQEIMSQFDVFTELDPLGTKANDTEIGTGKIKPYVDKKHFFQELKNPPKKVLNDLVSAQPLEASLFPANFEQTTNSGKNVYSGDPFGEDPFGQDDPFAEADFAKNDVFEEFSDFKVPVNDPPETKNNGGLTRTEIFGLFESPKKSVLEKQVSLAGTSPRTTSIFKQSTFDSTTQFDYKKSLTKLYENPSLDLSSESECAPDPPPRPSNTLPQIKPPPLPPKKQLGDLSAKPPPRPPHTEESHYDYMDKYETSYKTKSPPLPVPLRKSKFESDFQPEEEDYLTPVSFPTVKKAGPVLLPPPQRANKKKAAEAPQNLTNLQLDGLDITLSQLTLSGLNELAQKLQIPANQLSNMTLVQLTTFLSNFIKNTPQPEPQDNTEDNFKADFADFNNFSATSNSTYDRYAVFRELLQEETIKQTKIDEEPQEITEEKVVEVEETEEEEEIVQVVEEVKEVEKEVEVVDRYAALREIVESELKITDTPRISEEIEEEDEEEEEDDDHLETIDEVIAEQNNINDDLSLSVDPSTPPNSNDLKIIDDVKNDNSEKSTKESIIDYNNVLDNSIISIEAKTSPKSKSPIPIAVAEIQNNARLNSGSISDVISGSSPEVDLTGSENAKKTDTGESWAIFDQPNLGQEGKEAKAGQSEEGVSPWSSDSKEYGNGSPPDWRQRIDSGSGGDQWGGTARRRDQEGWWDTSAEPEVQYYPSNRRSTDSYEDECYDCYERPRRRRQTTWSGQATGGHSSSSRDVSPWEEEPRRRDGRQSSWSSRHSRQHSFERHSRRHTDSWDEEDDYEYEDEHSGRFHWPERHGSRESDRERHVGGGRELERDRHGGSGGRELDEWEDRRVHRRRREMDRERWCCPDYDLAEPDKPGRYSSGRWSNPERRKYEDRYYGKEQESPWEDEYGGEIENPQPHYLTARRTRIRPSSASEMDRKTGEIKSRPGQYYYGGSDGERDRRYKSGRRSKSRDSSQYSDPTHRHKPETLPRNPHRLKQHQKFDPDFPQDLPPKKPDGPPKDVLKKPPARSKKQKESPKSEEPTTFPRKSAQRAQSLFENDFVPEPEAQQRFSFENEFETSEADSPLPKPKPKKKNWFDEERRGKKMTRYKQKSLFEDDFSPTDKAEGEEIPSIKEEFLEESDTVSSDLSSRKRLMKIGRIDMNLKKSESVNIFGRENDPFDDDFFSGANGSECSDLKWTQQFSDFDIQRAK